MIRRWLAGKEIAMRVVLIEGQPLFCEGFARRLNECEGLSVVGTSAHARDGLHVVHDTNPDVAVVDLVLPGMSGIATIREMRRRHAALRILATGAVCHERDVLDALEAGALGFVAKTERAEVFADGIRTVARNERFFGPAARVLALSLGAEGRHCGTPAGGVLACLSAREREVFELLVRGFKNRDVAAELCISVKTVETHRLHINKKLVCSSAMDLLQFALANGILATRPREVADDIPRPRGEQLQTAST
jgi:two-component system secretion response regulator SsrB